MNTTRVDNTYEELDRRFKGQFYTPKLWVDECIKIIKNKVPNLDDYVVWDCASGSGNLTRDTQNVFKTLYSSTLEDTEINIQREYNINEHAKKVFKMDFLNDDIDIINPELVNDIKSKKKLLFFVNPPYAASGNNKRDKGSKKSVGKTQVRMDMQIDKLGKAASNLYVQFLYKMNSFKEKYNLDDLIICSLTPTSHLQNQSFEKWRMYFLNKYNILDGFCFPSKEFSGVKANWPVNFCIYKSKDESEKIIHNDHYFMRKESENGKVIDKGLKNFYNLDKKQLCSKWIREDLKGLKTKRIPKMSSGLKLNTQLGRGGLGLLCDTFKVEKVNNYTINVVNDGTVVNGGNIVNNNTQNTAVLNSPYTNQHDVNIINTGALMSGSNLIDENRTGISLFNSPYVTGGDINIINTGALYNGSNSVYKNIREVCLLNAPFSDSGTDNVIINEKGTNLFKIAALYTARSLITQKHITWDIDRDEYVVPDKKVLDSEEYKQWNRDCFINMLFSSKSNQTPHRGVLMDGEVYDIYNPFTPFGFNEATKIDKFNDTIYNDYVGDRLFYIMLRSGSTDFKLSTEAIIILEKGVEFMYKVVSEDMDEDIIKKYNLDCWDCGFYQIKKAVKEVPELKVKYIDELNIFIKEFDEFCDEKLRPSIYKFGFLLK